jgi:intracellular multiplication protein IcmK
METGIKRLFLIFAAAALLAGATPVFAQDANDFDAQFDAFKKKAAAARDEMDAPTSRGEAKATASDEKEKEEDKAAQETAVPSEAPPALDAAAIGNPLKTSGNPLGPAATLPVAGVSPVSVNPLTGQPQTPEEVQAAAEAELAAQKKKIDEETFNEALKFLLPMKPDQIRKMLDTFKDSRQAAETPIAVPEPKVHVETISLDPSQTPLVIKTSPTRVTTLTVLDATGAPWPIQDVSWAGKFDVVGPEDGGHVIRITPQTAHGMGNISIRLVDLITPITFTLQTGLDEVYYRFDARIPKQGPLAKTPLIANGGLRAVVGNDENLVQVLDGMPPAKAEKLKIDGVDGRTTAFRLSGHIYLRTPLTLLSPSWDASVSSADGMNVYTLGDTPIVLLSDEGRMVRARLADEEVTHDE